jgi:hypothetical protein
MLLPVTLIRPDSFWSEDYSGACQYSTHASSFKGILSQSIIFAIRSLSCWDKEPITSKKAMIANVKTCENMWKPYLFVSSIFPFLSMIHHVYSNHQKTHEISGKKLSVTELGTATGGAPFVLFWLLCSSTWSAKLQRASTCLDLTWSCCQGAKKNR